MAVVIAIIIQCSLAQAHVRSESFSSWHINGESLRATFTVSAREATRVQNGANLAPLNDSVAHYLADKIKVRTLSGNCRTIQPFTATRSRPGYVRVEAEWRCNAAPDTLEIRAFFGLAPEHVHFATLHAAGQFEQRLMTETNPIWRLERTSTRKSGATNSSAGFWSYVVLGLMHISSGYDHVAFLLALLLICRRFKDIVIAVSGFTIGHSLTLALGVFGMLRPSTLAIEATIGLTIALVAVEHSSRTRRSALTLAGLTAVMLLAMAILSINQVGQVSAGVFIGLAVFSFCYLLLSHDLQGRVVLRVLMTVLFGLIHGLGFAVTFIDKELPSELLAPLLLGFNTGVEIGQLAIIGLMLLVFVLLRSRFPARALYRLNEICAAGLCGVGIFLLIHRTYSPVIVG